MPRTLQLEGQGKNRPKKIVDRNLRSLRRHALAGVGVMAALVLGMGGWAATTSVEGAVIASGVVVAEGGSRRVQHPEGGVVRQILVKNNEQVEAGQLLLTLDDVSVRAELEVVLTQLREGLGTQARLTAESTGAAELQLPAMAAEWPQDPKLSVVMGEQQRLRQSRKLSLESSVARFQELIAEKRSLIDGHQAQLQAYEKQRAVVEEELTQLTTLHTKELVSAQRLNEMKRSEAELAGQVASVRASISATESSIAELQMQADQKVSDFRSDALSQLQDVSQTVAELMQRMIAAEATLKRLEVRAPIAGTVHQSSVRTVGGVVTPADTLMLIVPQDDHLMLDMRVSPTEISKLHVGQATDIRISNFAASTTPDMAGSVNAISPDMIQDNATGMQYYSVRIDIDESELHKLPEGAVLVPGMPAESFFQTGERTIWAYLVGPLAERFSHSFR